MDSPFSDLMIRVRTGDEEAARIIFKQFGNRLIGLARSRMSERMRQKVDPEDVMQSVFKSFFRRNATEPFELENWDNLWSLLTVFTLRKCGFRSRHYLMQCRDLRREISPALDNEESHASWEAIAREPSPAEIAMLSETVEELLRGLEQRDRMIVELSLQGFDATEVSLQVNCSERTVQRLLARVKQRLERQGKDECEDRS